MLWSIENWWYGGTHRFPGNQWDKPIGEDELLYLLYYPLREIAFVIDFVWGKALGWVEQWLHGMPTEASIVYYRPSNCQPES